MSATQLQIADDVKERYISEEKGIRGFMATRKASDCKINRR